MAVPKLIGVLIGAVMLLMALSIRHRQSRVAGLWVIGFCQSLLYFNTLCPTEFISGQGSGMSK